MVISDGLSIYDTNLLLFNIFTPPSLINRGSWFDSLSHVSWWTNKGQGGTFCLLLVRPLSCQCLYFCCASFSDFFLVTLHRNFSRHLPIKMDTIPFEFYYILTIPYFLWLERNQASKGESDNMSDSNGGRLMFKRKGGTISPPYLCPSRRGNVMVPELQKWWWHHLLSTSVQRIRSMQWCHFGRQRWIQPRDFACTNFGNSENRNRIVGPGGRHKNFSQDYDNNDNVGGSINWLVLVWLIIHLHHFSKTWGLKMEWMKMLYSHLGSAGQLRWWWKQRWPALEPSKKNLDNRTGEFSKSSAYVYASFTPDQWWGRHQFHINSPGLLLLNISFSH